MDSQNRGRARPDLAGELGTYKLQKARKPMGKVTFSRPRIQRLKTLCFPGEMELQFMKINKMTIEKLSIINVFAT